MIMHAAGYPTPPSLYGYSRAAIVPYDVQCNGTESTFEECVIDKSLEFPSDVCQDPASSAAGVVCSIASELLKIIFLLLLISTRHQYIQSSLR